jgi:hypothetical protein
MQAESAAARLATPNILTRLEGIEDVMGNTWPGVVYGDQRTARVPIVDPLNVYPTSLGHSLHRVLDKVV